MGENHVDSLTNAEKGLKADWQYAQLWRQPKPLEHHNGKYENTRSEITMSLRGLKGKVAAENARYFETWCLIFYCERSSEISLFCFQLINARES